MNFKFLEEPFRETKRFTSAIVREWQKKVSEQHFLPLTFGSLQIVRHRQLSALEHKMKTSQQTPSGIDLQISRYIDALAVLNFKTFPAVLTTLDSVPDLARRLLALRGYLVKENTSPGAVRIQWAFSQQEFDDFRDTHEGGGLTRELKVVMDRFDQENSGFRLVRGSLFRSLLTQIAYWNSIKRHDIQMVADALMQNARKVFTKKSNELIGSMQVPEYPMIEEYNDATQLWFRLITPPGGGVPGALFGTNPEAQAKFARFVQLKNGLDDFAEVIRKATLLKAPKTATPGLSDHGQSRAIDFGVQNLKTGTKILGASNASAWRETGFAQKLATAMTASNHFHGPLRVPDEPWHWDFEH